MYLLSRINLTVSNRNNKIRNNQYNHFITNYKANPLREALDNLNRQIILLINYKDLSQLQIN